MQRWRFSWAWTVGVTLVLSGCAGISIKPKPVPTSTPPPGPPGAVCAAGQAYGCWNQPPGEPWQFACPVYDAAGGVVGVVNAATPEQCPAKPGPDVPPPDQPPSIATNCDGEPGSKTTERPQTFAGQVNEAIHQVTGCTIGSDCSLDATTRQSYQRAVVEALRGLGVCSGQHEPGVTDEIVAAEDQRSLRSSWHIFAGDDSEGPLPAGGSPRRVVWAPFAARDAYQAPVGQPDQPPVTPPGTCAAPQPPERWTTATLPPGWDSALVGKKRWLLVCVPHQGKIDCSPNNQRACEYCDAIGMGTYADGQLRCGCPVRNEGVPDKVACEQLLYGATHVESRNGASCGATSNPMQFLTDGSGDCRLCSSGGPDDQVCGEWQ